jgi:putative transposase
LIKTYHYRIKDSGKSGKILKKMASSVNFVWNYCKITQKSALKNKPVKQVIDSKTGKVISIPYFFSKFEMNALVSGSSKELGIHSQSIQAVSEEYTTRRKQFKNILRWRGKKSLGWIPFKSSAIKLDKNQVSYSKHKFSYWNSRDLPIDAKIKSGSFSQDSRDRWYLNITFETSIQSFICEDQSEIGIFIGDKSLVSCSNGTKIKKPILSLKVIKKLKNFNKSRKIFLKKIKKLKKNKLILPKLKQEKNLKAKIANIKQDYYHKESTKIVKNSSLIILNSHNKKSNKLLKKRKPLTLSSDIKTFQNMLCYKAVRAGRTYKVIPGKNQNWTFSKCCIMRPRIRIGMRVWKCRNCNKVNDYGANASIHLILAYKNSLRIGHDTPQCI